jgi:hypothetical protein
MSCTGILLAESLRSDAVLEGVPLHVHRIRRANAGDTSAGQPLTWTFIEFEVPDASARRLAELLSTTLTSGPWYCDLSQQARDHRCVRWSGVPLRTR